MKKKRPMKVTAVLLCFVLLLLPLTGVSQAASQPVGKIINVVYDDSGSMVRSHGELTPRWSQAKYAMEVFCAMMGESDVMNIFPMSRYGSIGLTLYGNDSSRVSAVHSMNAEYSDTPFSAVTSAGENLLNADPSYEKWLVVITDGAFDDGYTPIETVQSTFDSYVASGIKTVYLAIGDDASVIAGNPTAGAYVEKAADGHEVLSKVTSIANQIFEHQILSGKYLSYSGTTTSLDIDIPTDQIIVFAQGDNVTVGDLSLNGEKIKATDTQNVKYSDVIPENYSDAIKDTSLKGIVVTFNAGDTPFEDGTFSISVSNASTVEYYYRPGVTVNCELLYGGNAVRSNDELYAGDYEVEVSFVNPLTGNVIESELLSQAQFTLSAINNGTEQYVSDKRGSVRLEEGSVDICAFAELPGHVVLSSYKSYVVCPEPIPLNFELAAPAEEFDQAYFAGSASPFVLRVTNGETGELLTEEQQAALKINIEEANGIKWQYERGSADSTWNLTPVSASGTIEGVSTGFAEFGLEASFQVGTQYGYGNGSFNFNVTEYAGSSLAVSVSAPTGEYDLNDWGTPESLTVTVMAENGGEYSQISEKLWNEMKLETDVEGRMGFNIEKGTEVGTYILTPEMVGGDPLLTSSGKVPFTVTASAEDGEYKYSGSGSQEISVIPLTTLNLLKALAPKLIAAAIILFLLLGYMPFIKHYLPKSLKKKPYIKCIPSEPGEKRKDRSGSYDKNFLSTFLPYVPQKGTIKYVPKGVTGAPALAVKGIKRRRMTITNIKAFVGKDYITFDGESIKADCKKFETGAGVVMQVRRKEWTYICTPNQSSK